MKKLFFLLALVFSLSITTDAQTAKKTAEKDATETVDKAVGVSDKVEAETQDAFQVPTDEVATTDDETDKLSLWDKIIMAVMAIWAFLQSDRFKNIFRTAESVAQITTFTEVDDRIIAAFRRILESIGIDPDSPKGKAEIERMKADLRGISTKTDVSQKA